MCISPNITKFMMALKNCMQQDPRWLSITSLISYFRREIPSYVIGRCFNSIHFLKLQSMELLYINFDIAVLNKSNSDGNTVQNIVAVDGKTVL